MLPTHQKHACPVCLHASHDGKLITHLRKLGLFRNFPPDYFLPSSENGRVLHPPSPLLRLNHCLSSLPPFIHVSLPPSLPFPFSLLRSFLLPISISPTIPSSLVFLKSLLPAEVNAIQQASGQLLATPGHPLLVLATLGHPLLVSQPTNICHRVPAALLVYGPQDICCRSPPLKPQTLASPTFSVP